MQQIRSFQHHEESCFYSAILANVQQVITAINPQGEIIFWNSYAEQFYGWKREEVLNRPITALQVSTAVLSDAQQVLSQALSAGHWEGRMIQQGADGQRLPVYTMISPIHDDQGQLQAFVCFTENISDHLRSEQALQASEERFTKAFHASPMAMLIVDCATATILDSNQRFVELIGITHDELLQHNINEVPLWSEPAMWQRILAHVSRTGSVQQLHTHTRTSGGKRRNLNLSIEPIEIADRASLLFIIQDVTEQHRQRTQREVQRLFFEQLATGASLLTIFNTLLQGMERYFEDCRTTMLIHNAEQQPTAFIAPSFAASVRAEISAALAENTSADPSKLLQPTFERINATHSALGRLLQAQGYTDLWTLPVYNRHTTLLGILYLCFEQPRQPSASELEYLNSSMSWIVLATERRSSDEALRQSELRHRSLLNALPDMILHLNQDGVCLDCTLGEVLPATEMVNVVGQPLESWLPASVAEQIRHAMQAARRSQTTQVIEYHLRRATADSDYEARVVSDSQGNAIVIVRDVTERKQLEAQFLQAQKMELVGRLAGGIAHDFNNLLVVINGSAALAADSLHQDDPVQQDLQEITHASERAVALTRQLLMFSRQQIATQQPLNLNELIVNLNRMMQRLIGEHIHMQLELASNLALVLGDTAQMEQVLINLVVNARDAMPHGGQLTIKTHNEFITPEVASLHVGLEPGAKVGLIVSDTGVGMTEQVRQQAFEPFFTTKPADKGTGLGLATCYGIVRRHQGWIGISSQVGLGSSFSIYLPQLANQQPQPVDAPRSAELHQGQGCVLVVEDDPAVQHLITRILNQHGYTVLQASDGQQALQIVAEHHAAIDVLFTDLVLPSMSGGALARAIRSLRPALKVVYSSGYLDDQLAAQTELLAEAPVLHKPFTPQELIRCIQAVQQTT